MNTNWKRAAEQRNAQRASGDNSLSKPEGTPGVDTSLPSHSAFPERSSKPRTCDICSQPLEGSMIGHGDGSGDHFAHPLCWHVENSERLTRELREANDRLSEASQEKTDAARYRWIRGAVYRNGRGEVCINMDMKAAGPRNVVELDECVDAELASEEAAR